jgi:putative hydrolase
VSRDFQVHTNWTDGQGTVSETISAAKNAKLKEIAFTEHARHTSTYYNDFFAEIEREAIKEPLLDIYKGFEVKIIDYKGTLDISDDMRACADIVLASVHSFPGPSRDTPIPPRMVSHEESIEIETALSLGVIEAESADVLSHPGGMSVRFHGSFPLKNYDRLLSAIKGSSVAFEINYSYHTSILTDLLKLVEKHDPLISIGSDVHALDTMGACRDALTEILKL